MYLSSSVTWSTHIQLDTRNVGASFVGRNVPDGSFAFIMSLYKTHAEKRETETETERQTEICCDECSFRLV